ncbi:MAG: DEAD/DEAH box helicase family protein [Betaproteobacteria bacterium]
MSELRDYQQSASDAIVSWARRVSAPICAELATGAGKSLIIADVARRINEMSGKKLLCLAPGKELVEQNYQKYIDAGSPASLFSAAVGIKSTRHPAVFGTPKTVLNALDRFKSDFAGIVIDECHRIDPTTKSIIAGMRDGNPNLRVIGLTATPYRLGDGYIYQIGLDNKQVGQANNPLFSRLVYRIQAQELVDRGFLTPPEMIASDCHYDAASLTLNKQNQFDAGEVAQVFEGKGRLTADIVADVIAKANHRFGVMFFAASIQHAQEIMESLPPEHSRLVTGATPKAERAKILSNFKAGRIHYIVNRDVLTTGFDAPNVGTIAIMRATESAGLLLQIIGRGLRLHEGKQSALILDYAENLTRHGLSSSNLNPEIKAKAQSIKDPIDVTCPVCNHINQFSAKPNKENIPVDANGYFEDAFGHRLLDASGHPIAAHFGQRCQHIALTQTGTAQCDHRWNYRDCPECGGENSLSARECVHCGAELVDPNDKLILKEVVETIKKARKEDWIYSDVKKLWAVQTRQNSIMLMYTLNDDKRVSEFIKPGADVEPIASRTIEVLAEMRLPGITSHSAITNAINDGKARIPTGIAWRKRDGKDFVEIKRRSYAE